MANKLWGGVKASGRWLERYLADNRGAEPAAPNARPAGEKPRPSPRPPRPEPEGDPLMSEPEPQVRRPTPTPAPTPPVAATHRGGGSQTPMLQMLEAADQMVAIATRWEPEGMLEVLEAYKLWPDVLHRLGQAWALMHRHAQEGYPLKPVVVELIESVHRHQELTASSAEEIAPTARALHREQIDALQDRRNAMWDHRANQDQAAA